MLSCVKKYHVICNTSDLINEKGTVVAPFSFIWFAQHERILTGASPQAALTVGRLQPKARVSIVRWNLKETVGKHLTRRTET